MDDQPITRTLTKKRPEKKPGERVGKSRNPNILEGLHDISLFIGKNKNTTIKWILKHGLPATKTPDGKWFTHKGLILQWIYAGHQAILKQKIPYTFEDNEKEALAQKMGLTLEQVEEIMDAAP